MSQEPEALQSSPTSAHFGIHRVYVEDLFGRYTYDLAAAPPSGETSKLMILYGDNGSGKTTLLRLIVNLLSHVDGKGHKARVADIKFKRFVIWVGSFTVEAYRETLDGRGFTAKVSDADGSVVENGYYFADSEKPAEKEHRHQRLLKALKEINVGLFFLADDRKVTSNILAEAEGPDHPDEDLYDLSVTLGRHGHEDMVARKRKVADKVLDDAVARVSSWATSKALSGSTQGEEDVNTIYSRIIQQLARTSGRSRLKPVPRVDALLSALQDQYERSLAFSQFGLTSPPKIDKLLTSVTKAPKPARDAIAKVLAPYVDSMKARLDALQDVQNSISSLVEGINAFYTDKAVRFDLQKGLLIHTRDGTVLKPTMLSSGERQLLLLFCNTVIAKQRPSIFIIDEPEISLNVKWQRQLVHSLLAATKGSQMQFILATHSIELLTRYRQYVVDLSPSANRLLQ